MALAKNQYAIIVSAKSVRSAARVSVGVWCLVVSGSGSGYWHPLSKGPFLGHLGNSRVTVSLWGVMWVGVGCMGGCG